MWTLIIHHESNECNESDRYDNRYDTCLSTVSSYECASEEEILKHLTDMNYNDQYHEDGLYYWYLFQGQDLNGSSDWSKETTGGLDLSAIVGQAASGAKARWEAFLEKKRQHREREAKSRAELAKKVEELKVRSAETSEKAELDRLLRKHGLPEWAGDTPKP